MYLKSLEIHGFKSFANKIVFEFHNGITGIVGPNGSGKSNVADAVRWVLGEQSIRQLRGSSMQDVIFAGTENRKPLSYAYVAITLDNTDHKLAIDFEEVTIARRLYRSGESEYLINGSVCRLKEVSELFYDTGIGKEGYSMIGQGQIDRILSGKPEEKRELFDEAAGIVKFKKRKITAQKKLESEEENLLRVNDILTELERQVEPLQKQSEKAKLYLRKKSELKECDANLFLMEMEQIEREKQKVTHNYQIADFDLQEETVAYEKIKTEYETLQKTLKGLEEEIHRLQEQIGETAIENEKMQGQISILKEQIHTVKMTDAHYRERYASIGKEKNERFQEKGTYLAEKAVLEEQLTAITKKKQLAEEEFSAIQREIADCNAQMEEKQQALLTCLHQNALMKAQQQKYTTMLEQMHIRKAEVNKRFFHRKTEEENLISEWKLSQAALHAVKSTLETLQNGETELLKKRIDWKQKENEINLQIEEYQIAFHKNTSRLEFLKNIAERYDGYGTSIRKVMEQKSENAGILGVVSDLMQVQKQYETAIETALGGSIQFIVTEEETTAKKMIAYLKKYRFGRATFLPLTSVNGRKNTKNETIMQETGVIGLASQLVICEEKYKKIAEYLLGRIVVVDTIDHAMELAKKGKHALHIVTLEGESFSPGGSITGGAFKHSSHLLARNREIEELEAQTQSLKQDLQTMQEQKNEIVTALELHEEELTKIRTKIQNQRILQTSTQMDLERVEKMQKEKEHVFAGLMEESQQIQVQIEKIQTEQSEMIEKEQETETQKQQIEENLQQIRQKLENYKSSQEQAKQTLSSVTMEEAAMEQKCSFFLENINRINREIEKYDREAGYLTETVMQAKEKVNQKQNEIEQMKKTMQKIKEKQQFLEKQLAENLKKKEQLSETYNGYFQKQEEISKRKHELEKELLRLNGQLETLHHTEELQRNYMWEEYELTPHEIEAFRSESYTNLAKLKAKIGMVKEDIRKLGNVNVNAIEEYKEVRQRYDFLKTQHEDLIEAKETLLQIIEELDAGMRKQFEEKFGQMQREFDTSFRLLFGGGHGTLELVEDEDILECGIRIIAQPPGKKLQNMMQLSGGEKALTAIALLFAIQSLKPSPFCLLDEIEAALDDSNVTRFAQYLKRLTKDTQFIVITHRRGTMTAADRLYGITMQEKGVSTLVSVNLVEHTLET